MANFLDVSLLLRPPGARRGRRHQLVVESEPDISGAITQRDPYHAIPLAPGTADPTLEHAGNPAGDGQAVGNHPPAVPRRQRERQVEVDPYRPRAHRLATGDAIPAVGANPPERHACSPIDSLSPERGGARLASTHHGPQNPARQAKHAPRHCRVLIFGWASPHVAEFDRWAVKTAPAMP